MAETKIATFEEALHLIEAWMEGKNNRDFEIFAEYTCRPCDWTAYIIEAPAGDDGIDIVCLRVVWVATHSKFEVWQDYVHHIIRSSP